MTFPVQVGPSTITINRDDRVLVVQPDGRILGDADGLLHPRHPVHLGLRHLDQRPPADPARLGPDPASSRRATSSRTRPLVDADGPRRRANRWRSASTGRSPTGSTRTSTSSTTRAGPCGLTIEIAVHSDFADIFDVKGGQLVRRGELELALVPVATRAAHVLRQPRLPARARSSRSRTPTSPPQFANGRLAFVATIPPKGEWHTCLRWLPVTRTRPPARDAACNAVDAPLRKVGARHLPNVSVQTPNQTVDRAWDQAVRDLEALRARGSRVRARRVHPGGGRALVRDAVRARLADRIDAGHLGFPRVRGRGLAPPVGAAGDRGRPRARHGARQDPARDPARRARRSSGSCRSSRTTGRTTRRASSSSCCRTCTTGPATRASCGATCRTRKRR